MSSTAMTVGSNAAPKGAAIANLRSARKLACPQCGQCEKLTIEIVCLAELTAHKLKQRPRGKYWGDQSPCTCPACRYHGILADFDVCAEVQPCP
jgi:hypothetical protein